MTKLPRPRFNLKAPNVSGESLIVLVYRYKGKRLVYSTGLTIDPVDWNPKTQRPIEQEDRINLWKITNELDDLVARCKAIYIDTNYGMIGVAEFKDRLNKQDAQKKHPSTKRERPSFFEFIQAELADMKAANMKHGSFKIFRQHAIILQDFAKYQGQFTYEDVDWNFRLELIDWLASRKAQLAYGNKTLSILRQFLEKARRKKLHTNTEYHGVGWAVTRKKATSQKVILTTNELAKLAEFQLSPYLKKVRDLFLIGAGTGQRFSDFSRYTQNNFYTTVNGVPILSVISQKTDTPAKIPLNLFPWLVPILEEYDYCSPTIAMQNFNEMIKEVCKIAGFDMRVLKVEQYIGRKATIKQSYVLKYESVSSHTCRRSFATNLYRMGYSLAQIMPMTGHATESQLREYIGVDAEENAEQIALAIQRQNQQ